MIGEIWEYEATKPNDGMTKSRPVLIIGDDGNNQLQFVDVHYAIISSSADCGIYDVRLEATLSKQTGVNRDSVIKTTKIYTGSKTKMRHKRGELPSNKKEEFIQKYKDYQLDIVSKFQIS